MATSVFAEIAEAFQSAPPVKGAIPADDTHFEIQRFQSAPPVKGAILQRQGVVFLHRVSIRAPREGGDRGSLESFPAQGKKRVFREP